MEAIDNDRWHGTFVVDALGHYEYTVEGWIRSVCRLAPSAGEKDRAGQDVASELLEGAALVLDAGERIADGETGTRIGHLQRVLGAADEEMGARLAAALSEDLGECDGRASGSQPGDAVRSGSWGGRGTRAGAIRRVVRDVPALGQPRSVAQRHL